MKTPVLTIDKNYQFWYGWLRRGCQRATRATLAGLHRQFFYKNRPQLSKVIFEPTTENLSYTFFPHVILSVLLTPCTPLRHQPLTPPTVFCHIYFDRANLISPFAGFGILVLDYCFYLLISVKLVFWNKLSLALTKFNIVPKLYYF